MCARVVVCVVFMVSKQLEKLGINRGLGREALIHGRFRPASQLFNTVFQPPREMWVRCQWQLLPTVQMHGGSQRNVGNGWVDGATNPLVLRQALIEDTGEFMEILSLGIKHRGVRFGTQYRFHAVFNQIHIAAWEPA